MTILSVLALLVLALFFGGMCALRKCVARRPEAPPEAVLEKRAERWGVDAAALRAGADWFLAQGPEEVSILSFDGLRLTGRWLPAEASRGRILLFHGYRSGGLQDFSCALPFYHGLGYDLLLVDQRAHGASEGRCIGLGVLERRDCGAWLDYANARFGDGVPTFLAGVSMGATTVLLAAGEPLPGNVRGLIADCGFTSPWDIVVHETRKLLRLPPYPLVPLVSGLCRLTAGYGLRDGSTTAALERSRLPVLFLHGEADDFVPVDMTCRNYAACRAEKRLLLVPGADHCACFAVGGDACRRETAAFLAAHTPDPDAGGAFGPS